MSDYGALEEGPSPDLQSKNSRTSQAEANPRLTEMIQTCCAGFSAQEFGNLANLFSALAEEGGHKLQNNSDASAPEDYEQWKGYIEDDLDVGMFTLIAMAPKIYKRNDWRNVLIPQFLLSLVLFVQLVVPACIVYSEGKNYDQGICPSNAEIEDRIIAFSIGAIYVARLTFIMANKIMGDTSDADLPLRREWQDPGPLLYNVLADRFMDVAYEGAVYILNLWLVFSETSDPINMIWNSLALEFILQLDDEVKGLYLSVYPVTPVVVSRFKDANNEGGSNPIGSCQLTVVRIVSKVKHSVALTCLFFVYVSFFYLPICKPGVVDLE